MPPRPIAKSRDRPTSAIYLGSSPAPSPSSVFISGHASITLTTASPVPDLPEPPSPVSSVGSGLPSPPATNSTGSGSTGDPASIALRRQSAPMAAQNTQGQTGSSDSGSTRSSSRLSWKHEDLHLDHPLDQDEDQTMRLKIGNGASNELVLQRARNLAQRNKLQLDKLASGKLGRASPSSSSSSRNHRYSMPEPSQVLSGSETEREGDSVVSNSISNTSSGSKSKSSIRARLSSAPTSPHRTRTYASGNDSGASSPTRRRKRASLVHTRTASFDDNSDDANDNYDENTQRDGERYGVGPPGDRIQDRQETLRDDNSRSRASTVNLNSLKKTPTGGTRRRSALPREFREGSVDEHTTDEPPLQTPFRTATAPPPSSANVHSTSTMSNSVFGRRSTLRGARGLSDDYRSSPSYSIHDLPSQSRSGITPINTNTGLSPTSTFSSHTPNTAIPDTPATAKSTGTTTSTNYNNSPTIHARSNTIGRHTAARRERRQTLRGGSAESALGGLGGRSLVSEGLRAAGLSRRVDVGVSRDRERERVISTPALEARDREFDRTSMASGSSNRSRRGDYILDTRASDSPDVFRQEGGMKGLDWSPESTQLLTRKQQQRRSVFGSSEFGPSSRTVPPRASTSMADYSYTSRTRSRVNEVSHSDSEDDFGHGDGDNVVRNGRRSERTYKGAYSALTSREASLSRREENLMEKERELRRRERELERGKASSVLGRHHISGPATVTATPSPTPTPYASSMMRERGEGERYSGVLGNTRRTPGGSQHLHLHPEYQGNSQQTSQPQSEHAKLMVDSLSMFENQLTKLTPVLGTMGTNHSEMLTRNAQQVVVNAERLNTMLRSGNSRALDAQIEAEVEGDFGPGPALGPRNSLVDVWRKVGGDYREGLRVSDELIRAVTGLLLGVGKVMKEYMHTQQGRQYSSEAGSTYGGTPRGSPAAHGRSISLGEEDMRMRSGAVSPDSKESKRSWEPALSNGGSGGERDGGSSNASVTAGIGSREEALRRLAGVRPDSPLARASPAFRAVRELDRQETSSPALGTSGLGLPKVNMPGRRLFAPSQQREMALVAENGQHTCDHDPSPTPASRTRALYDQELTVPMISSQKQYQHSPLQHVQEMPPERSRTLTLPPQTPAYETPLRRNTTVTGAVAGDGANQATSSRDRHERRKISIASITTIRGATSNTGASGSSVTSSSGVSVPIHRPGLSTLSTPSGATTAVTLDHSVMSPMSIARTESNNSGASPLHSVSTKPTFSRPEGISGLQQNLEGYKRRAEGETLPEGASVSSGASAGAGNAGVNGKERGGNGNSLITPESQRETRRKTLGIGSRAGARISLDGVHGGAGEFGDHSGAASGRGVVDLTVNAADRSAAVTLGTADRKDRRRTVADIWPRG